MKLREIRSQSKPPFQLAGIQFSGRLQGLIFTRVKTRNFIRDMKKKSTKKTRWALIFGVQIIFFSLSLLLNQTVHTKKKNNNINGFQT